MRLEWRIERVQHGGFAGQNDRHRRQRAQHGNPERDPGRAAHRQRGAQSVLRDDVPEAHDEECGEDERHQGAVRRDRHVIHAGRPEGQVQVGAGERLHDGHCRGHPERRDGNADVGQGQAREAVEACARRPFSHGPGRGHFESSTMIRPDMT